LIVSVLITCIPISAIADESRAQRLESLVHDHLGIYVVTKARRDLSETITYEQGRLTVIYRWSKENRLRGLLCTGGRWVSVGRLVSSKGARALFKTVPRLRELTVRFVTVTTAVQPIGDGKYRQVRQVQTLGEFTLSRRQAAKLDPQILRETLQGKRCDRFVRTLIDDVRLRPNP
jgi:hypothetical protein